MAALTAHVAQSYGLYRAEQKGEERTRGEPVSTGNGQALVAETVNRNIVRGVQPPASHGRSLISTPPAQRPCCSSGMRPVGAGSRPASRSLPAPDHAVARRSA